MTLPLGIGGDISSGSGATGCRTCDLQPRPNRFGYLGIGMTCGCGEAEASVSCPAGPLPPGDGTGGIHDFQLCW